MKSDKEKYMLYDSIYIKRKYSDRADQWFFANDTKVWGTTMDSDGYVC